MKLRTLYFLIVYRWQDLRIMSVETRHEIIVRAEMECRFLCTGYNNTVDWNKIIDRYIAYEYPQKYLKINYFSF